jgi:hypothetical protein
MHFNLMLAIIIMDFVFCYVQLFVGDSETFENIWITILQGYKWYFFAFI